MDSLWVYSFVCLSSGSCLLVCHPTLQFDCVSQPDNCPVCFGYWYCCKRTKFAQLWVCSFVCHEFAAHVFWFATKICPPLGCVRRPDLHVMYQYIVPNCPRSLTHLPRSLPHWLSCQWVRAKKPVTPEMDSQWVYSFVCFELPLMPVVSQLDLLSSATAQFAFGYWYFAICQLDLLSRATAQFALGIDISSKRTKFAQLWVYSFVCFELRLSLFVCQLDLLTRRLPSLPWVLISCKQTKSTQLGVCSFVRHEIATHVLGLPPNISTPWVCQVTWLACYVPAHWPKWVQLLCTQIWMFYYCFNT